MVCYTFPNLVKLENLFKALEKCYLSNKCFLCSVYFYFRSYKSTKHKNLGNSENSSISALSSVCDLCLLNPRSQAYAIMTGLWGLLCLPDFLLPFMCMRATDACWSLRRWEEELVWVLGTEPPFFARAVNHWATTSDCSSLFVLNCRLSVS